MTRISHFLIPFLVLLLTSSQPASAFSSVYAFGDSLSDTGNSESSIFSIYNILGQCHPARPCPPYDQGRYSNGPVAVERFADAILPGGSNVDNFHNFSVAGSTTGIGNAGDGGAQTKTGAFLLPGMAQQIGAFLSGFSGHADTNALYFVWGGANDYVAGDSAQSAAQNIADYVDLLAEIGAQTIMVPNLPDLSLTPSIKALGNQEVNLARSFSLDFNQTLTELLNTISISQPNTQIKQFDSYGFFNTIFQNPGAYGFDDVTTACVSLPTICSNPETHVFWDGFHPTAQMHALAAGAMVSQIPLPAAIWLFFSGLIPLFLRQPYSAQIRINLQKFLE